MKTVASYSADSYLVRWGIANVFMHPGKRTESKNCRDVDTGLVGVLGDEIAIHVGMETRGFRVAYTQIVVVPNSCTEESIGVVGISQFSDSLRLQAGFLCTGLVFGPITDAQKFHLHRSSYTSTLGHMMHPWLVALHL